MGQTDKHLAERVKFDAKKKDAGVIEGLWSDAWRHWSSYSHQELIRTTLRYHVARNWPHSEANRIVPVLMPSLGDSWKQELAEILLGRIDRNWTKLEAASKTIPALLHEMFARRDLSRWNPKTADRCIEILHKVSPNWATQEESIQAIQEEATSLIAVLEDPRSTMSDVSEPESILEYMLQHVAHALSEDSLLHLARLKDLVAWISGRPSYNALDDTWEKSQGYSRTVCDYAPLRNLAHEELTRRGTS